MSITTIEQLEALPAGAQITVTSTALGDQRWEKGDGVLVREGAAVRPITFIGAINAGQVRMVGEEAPTAPSRVGRVYHAGPIRWVIHTEDPNGDLYSMRFDEGSATYTLEDHRPSFFGDAWNTERWGPAVASMARDLYEAQKATPAPAGLDVERLHAFISERSWYDTDDRHALDEFLTREGYSREAEHATSVRMWGSLPVSHETLGLDSSVELENNTVDWTKVVTVTRTGVGCTCEEVSRDDMHEYVPTGGTLDDFEVIDCA